MWQTNLLNTVPKEVNYSNNVKASTISVPHTYPDEMETLHTVPTSNYGNGP